MISLPKDISACVPYVTTASQQENPLESLKEALAKIFQSPKYIIQNGVLLAQIESSILEVRVDGPGRFRTNLNSNPNGGLVAGFDDGKSCDARELLRELLEFEDIPRG